MTTCSWLSQTLTLQRKLKILPIILPFVLTFVTISSLFVFLVKHLSITLSITLTVNMTGTSNVGMNTSTHVNTPAISKDFVTSLWLLPRLLAH